MRCPSGWQPWGSRFDPVGRSRVDVRIAVHHGLCWERAARAVPRHAVATLWPAAASLAAEALAELQRYHVLRLWQPECTPPLGVLVLDEHDVIARPAVQRTPIRARRTPCREPVRQGRPPPIAVIEYRQPWRWDFAAQDLATAHLGLLRPVHATDGTALGPATANHHDAVFLAGGHPQRDQQPR